MSNVIHFRKCSKCGALLLTTVAVCHCVVRDNDAADTEQMPLSPAMIQPVVLQTSTSLSEGFAMTYPAKR